MRKIPVETIRDVVMGASDGFTVPFGVTAGLTGAVASSHIVLIGGLMEITAGSISMGLAALQMAKAEAERYELDHPRHGWLATVLHRSGTSRPTRHRELVSALTVSAAYVAAGLVPLSPYAFIHSPSRGLAWSTALTGVALLGFGWAKGKAIGAHAARSALETVAISGLAAAAAYVIARLCA